MKSFDDYLDNFSSVSFRQQDWSDIITLTDEEKAMLKEYEEVDFDYEKI